MLRNKYEEHSCRWNVTWRLSNCLIGFTHPRRNCTLAEESAAQLERDNSFPSCVFFARLPSKNTFAQLSPLKTFGTKTDRNKYSKSNICPADFFCQVGLCMGGSQFSLQVSFWPFCYHSKHSHSQQKAFIKHLVIHCIANGIMVAKWISAKGLYLFVTEERT